MGDNMSERNNMLDRRFFTKNGILVKLELLKGKEDVLIEASLLRSKVSYILFTRNIPDKFKNNGALETEINNKVELLTKIIEKMELNL